MERRRACLAEVLEARCLLSTVTWTGAHNTGLWTDPLNWTGGSGVPGALDSVTIGSGFTTITIDSGTQAVHTLSSASPLQISGGSLAISSTATISTNLTLAGGTLQSTTISTTGSAALTFTNNGSNRLVNVAISGDMSLAGSGIVRVAGTFGLTGVATIGNGIMAFEGASPTIGSGTFLLGGGALGLYGQPGTQTLTIGSGVTVHGTGTVGPYELVGGTTGNLVNQGTISADVSGQILNVTPPNNFTNQGTASASGGGILDLNNAWSSAAGTLAINAGTLNLGGTFTTAGLHLSAFTRTGGIVNITGMQDNSTTGPLAFNAATGSWVLSGGTVSGGTITETAGSALTFTNNGSNRLVNVAVTGDLSLAGSNTVRVAGTFGITGIATIGNGIMAFEGASPTIGSGTFLLGGGALGIYGQAGTQTLTIAAGVTVHGTGAVGPYELVGGTTGNLVNQGTISADVSGQILSVTPPNSFTNQATASATMGGILDLNNAWSSAAGTLSVNAGTLNLGGTFNTAGLHLSAFTRTGGIVNITGTLDNSATGPLTFNAATGSWALSGGTVSGGTIADTGGAALTFTNNGSNRLVNVAVTGDLSLAGSGIVRIAGSFGITGIATIGDGIMAFEGTSPTISSGTFLLGGGALGIYGQPGTQTLTIAAGATVHGTGAVGPYELVGGTTGNLVNQGTISADISGQILNVTAPGTFTNQGAASAASGGILDLNNTWSSAAGTLAVNAGTLNLGGNFTTAGLDLPAFTRTGGTVNITGTLDNSTTGPLTFNAATGSWALSGGIVSGGTITETGGAALTFTNNGSNRLVNVAISGDMSLAGSGIVRIAGTFGITGVATIGDGIMAFEGASPTIGSGTFLLGGGALGLYGQPGTQTLTIASGVTVHGTGSVGPYELVGGTTGNLVNQGIISADVSGQILSVTAPNLFTNQATASATGGGILNLNNAWSSAAGTLSVNAGTLNLGGTFTTASLGLPAFTRTGGTVNITGTLDNSATGPLALNAATGSWALSGGTVSGGTITEAGGSALTFTNNGSNRLVNVAVTGNLSLAGSGIVRVAGTFGITGVATIGDGIMAFEGASPTIGSGTFLLGGGVLGLYGQGTQTLTIGPGVTVHGVGTVGAYELVGGTVGNLLNQGTITADVTGQVLNVTPPNNFTNQGTASASGGGSLKVLNASNLAGGVLTGGAWQAFSNSKLMLPASITTIAANVLLNGAASIITDSGGVNSALAGLAVIASGGSLSLQGGQGLFATPAGGTFTNHGTVTLGAGSHLPVAGAFTQGADGTFITQISGPTSASFGQIAATGTATVGGTLQATLGVGYDPAVGQSFAVVTGSSEVGTFSIFTGGITPSGRPLVIGYTATTATITINPAPAPTLLSTQIDDGNHQRSLVRSLKFTFSSPVTLAAGAITLALLNTGGSGTNDGSAPTNASIALGTPTSPDGGLSWVVPIVTTSTFSALGSLIDGIYTATVHASLVTDVLNRQLTGGDQTKTFHRLYGDINGDKRISNADFAFFSNTYNASFGQANYNPYFDFTNKNAKIGNADFTQFANRYNKQFIYTG
ncbi:MAG: tandem-95 repeat protein [Phycisphaerales bacterium]|nr:tandem-95 repeat protein [Phycisphaerales bacterium]